MNSAIEGHTVAGGDHVGMIQATTWELGNEVNDMVLAHLRSKFGNPPFTEAVLSGSNNRIQASLMTGY